MSTPLIFDRYFIDSCPPPIRMPYKSAEEFIRRPNVDPATRAECFLHFSSETVKKLKAKANDEMGFEIISSLQALSAHAWKAISRARNLQPEQITANVVVVGYRSKFPEPGPIPQAFAGNAVGTAAAIITAGEITEKGIGWVASKIKGSTVTAVNGRVIIDQIESWVKEPRFLFNGDHCGYLVTTEGGQRFDVFGNDFGWGRPLGIRRGGWDKQEGRMAYYPGREGGSIDVCIFLATETMKALLDDDEFMDTVG